MGHCQTSPKRKRLLIPTCQAYLLLCQNCWGGGGVLSQLLAVHLENNNLWHVFQSVYRSRHSTETAFLLVFNDVLTSSDSDHILILTLLDLSAAFDIINHFILLNHLNKETFLVSMTVILRSLSHILVGESRLFLFLVVNRSHFICCIAFFRVLY